MSQLEPLCVKLPAEVCIARIAVCCACPWLLADGEVGTLDMFGRLKGARYRVQDVVRTKGSTARGY